MTSRTVNSQPEPTTKRAEDSAVGPHFGKSGYTNEHCRCEWCRMQHAARVARYRIARGAGRRQCRDCTQPNTHGVFCEAHRVAHRTSSRLSARRQASRKTDGSGAEEATGQAVKKEVTE